MTSAGAALSPGHGYVQIAVAQPEHAKAGTLFQHLAMVGQHLAQLSGRNAVDLDIDVFALDARQSVAHRAAHIINRAAQRRHVRRNGTGQQPVL